MKSHSSTNVTGGDLAVRAGQVLDDLPAHPAHGLAAALARACVAATQARPPPAPRTSSSVIRPFGPVPSTKPDRRRAPARSGARAASPDTPRLVLLEHELPPAPRVGRGGSGRRAGRRLGAVVADHDEHGADGDDLALADEDPRDRARPPVRGSRPSSCRSAISTSGSSSASSWPSATSQRAISPSVRPSPRSGSLNSYAIGAPAAYRGVPIQASAGTIRTRSPPSTRQSESACSSPASSGAIAAGT